MSSGTFIRAQQLRKAHHVVARNRAEHGARFFLARLAAPKAIN